MEKIFSGCSACLLDTGEWFSGSPLVLRMSGRAFRGKVNKMSMIFGFGDSVYYYLNIVIIDTIAFLLFSTSIKVQDLADSLCHNEFSIYNSMSNE